LQKLLHAADTDISNRDRAWEEKQAALFGIYFDDARHILASGDTLPFAIPTQKRQAPESVALNPMWFG